MPHSTPTPPARFAVDLWQYRRAALRANEVEHLRRLVNALVDELLARDARLLELGLKAENVYDVHEVLMYAKGCSLTPLSGGIDDKE